MNTAFPFLALVAGISSQLQASDINRDEIMHLVETGKIQSLEQILSRYPEQKFGHLLDLEVEREHGRIKYELEFLHRDGHVIELEIDASNGEVLQQEIKD